MLIIRKTWLWLKSLILITLNPDTLIGTFCVSLLLRTLNRSDWMYLCTLRSQSAYYEICLDFRWQSAIPAESGQDSIFAARLSFSIKHAWFMQMMPSQAVYIKREKDEKNNESSGCRTNERSVSIYDGRRENPGYISVAVWWRWIIYDIFVWTFVVVDLSGVDFGSLPDEMIEKYSKVFSRGFMTDDMPERFISVSLRKLRRT